jgi:nitrite reductase/ring-hydroxylating ferredoxin subunit
MPADDLRWTSVGAIDDWKPGQGRMVQVGARRVAVFRTDAGFRAIKDACPHAGVSLAQGYLHDDTVVCPAHAWAFRLADGACIQGPASCSAVVYATRVTPAGQVEVGV